MAGSAGSGGGRAGRRGGRGGGRSTRINATREGVQVEGLRELNKGLRAMGPEAQKELKAVNRKVAELVAADSRAAALSLGGVAAKAAPSIRVSASASGAGIGFGGPRYPFAGGAEFGALNFKQFKPWRGNDSSAGYFVYPSIRRDADQIETEYTTAIIELAERLGIA